jgi:hypothetical protein
MQHVQHFPEGPLFTSFCRGCAGMVERIKQAWFQWIPSWLPIVMALCWIAMQYQRVEDRLGILEEQMKAVQSYISTQHEKSYSFPPQTGVQSGQQFAGDDSIER